MYQTSEGRLRELAKTTQELTLEQVIDFNNMDAPKGMNYNQLPRAYIHGDLKDNETLSNQQVCKLFYEICRINTSGGLYFLNSVIWSNIEAPSISLGVPPPPPPPPPPGGN